MDVRPACVLTACLAMAAAAPARAEKEPVELEPMVVRPLPNPLDDALEQLRRKMENAPELGDAQFQRDWTEVLAGMFVPPDPDYADRLEMRNRDGFVPGFAMSADWRRYERPPDGQ